MTTETRKQDKESRRDRQVQPNDNTDRFEPVLTALIAILGTLLGAVATHFFQRNTAERTARLNFSERLRQDRLNGYNAFADAANEYRHSQIERWHRLNQHPDAEVDVRPESYSKKSALRSAQFRIKLLSDDVQLHQLAEQAIESIRSIQRTGVDPVSAEDHEVLYKAATMAIDAFVQRASTDVQRQPVLSPPRPDRALG